MDGVAVVPATAVRSFNVAADVHPRNGGFDMLFIDGSHASMWPRMFIRGMPLVTLIGVHVAVLQCGRGCSSAECPSLLRLALVHPTMLQCGRGCSSAECGDL